MAAPERVRRARPRVAVAFARLILAVTMLVALGAPLVSPYSPEALDLGHRRAPPSGQHWFGTDELGRDVFARVVYGARVTLAVGLISAVVAGAVGIGAGALSGFAGGAVDAAMMRVTDGMLSVPRLPLLMIVSAVLDPTVAVLILIIGLAGWMETARLVRAEFLSHRDREFVLAARAAGASGLRIIGRHLLPAAAPSIAVSMTLAVARGMLLESALSFFGVGVQPPTPSWGNMLYQAQTTMSSEPWLALFPGLCIFITALNINVVGDEFGRLRQ